MRPNENTDKENQENLDTRDTTDPTELSKVHADKILQNLTILVPAKFTWTEKIVNLIKKIKKAIIDENENFNVDGTATGINVPILEALNLNGDLVINSNAKIAIQKGTHRVTKQKKKKKTFAPKRIKHKRNQPITYGGILRHRKWFGNLKGRQNSAGGERPGFFRRMRKNCLS